MDKANISDFGIKRVTLVESCWNNVRKSITVVILVQSNTMEYEVNIDDMNFHSCKKIPCLTIADAVKTYNMEK